MIKKNTLPLLILIILLFVYAGLQAEEKVIFIGEDDLWKSVNLVNLTLVEGKRGYYDITNRDYMHRPDKNSDLIFSFNDDGKTDSTGRYEITSSLTTIPAEGSYGRRAALFNGDNPVVINERSDGALFSTSTLWGDFSLEFRLFPATLKEGSTIFLWKGLQMIDNQLIPQEIRCTVTGRSLVWDFENFFLFPDSAVNRVSLKGDKLIPEEWSHHLLVFDSQTGLLEYRINNIPSDSTYTSKTGREISEYNIPIIGNQQSFPIELGENFTGLIDEFHISKTSIDSPQLNRFTPSGFLESEIIDLDIAGSEIHQIEAEYFTPENTSIRFELALSDQKLDLLGNDTEWMKVNPSEPINRKGRFLKIRARFNSEPAAESAPVLTNISIIYREANPPFPPLNVRLEKEDDKINLAWDRSIDPDVSGYLVYFGEEPGVFLAEGSPHDAGMNNSVTLEGLDLNKRYYFAVTTYRSMDSRLESRFSREISYSP